MHTYTHTHSERQAADLICLQSVQVLQQLQSGSTHLFLIQCQTATCTNNGDFNELMIQCQIATCTDNNKFSEVMIRCQIATCTDNSKFSEVMIWCQDCNMQGQQSVQ